VLTLTFQEKALCYVFIGMILYMGIAPFSLIEVFKSMV